MQANSTCEVYRQLFRRIIKEQLPWLSVWTTTPRRTMLGGSFEAKESTSMNTSRRSNGLWSKLGLSTRGADLVMVRRVEGLGRVRKMGTIERPASRAVPHGVRTTLPASDEESRTDEFLKEEKRKQAAKVMKTERVVGSVAGQSLTATDTEFVQHLGSNTADTQKDIAEEIARKSEATAADNDDLKSGRGLPPDYNNEHPEVDEEVKRGLVADSALPMGRTEKKVDDEEGKTDFKEAEHKAELKVDFSEHGSFRTL